MRSRGVLVATDEQVLTSSRQSRRRGLVVGAAAAALVVAGCGGEEFVAEFGCDSPEQQVVEGDLLIASPEDVESCSGLVEVTGRLRVAGHDVIPDGFDDHAGNDRLESLSGLENLQRVGDLLIEDNEALRSLDGLEGLRNVDDGMKIWENRELRSISGLVNARPRCGFTVSSNEKLDVLEGLEAIDVVECGVIVSSLPVQTIPDLQLRQAPSVSLEDLPHLSRIPAFGPGAELGSLGLSRLPAVTSLAPLKTVEHVAELSLSDLDVDGLEELSGWDPGPTSIALGDLELTSLAGLEHFVALDGLALARLADLQSLSALENLREIRGDLMINRLDALEALDFPALELVDGNVEITENPRLSKAAIDDFLERVQITGEVRDCLNATQKPCF